MFNLTKNRKYVIINFGYIVINDVFLLQIMFLILPTGLKKQPTAATTNSALASVRQPLSNRSLLLVYPIVNFIQSYHGKKLTKLFLRFLYLFCFIG